MNSLTSKKGIRQLRALHPFISNKKSQLVIWPSPESSVQEQTTANGRLTLSGFNINGGDGDDDDGDDDGDGAGDDGDNDDSDADDCKSLPQDTRC